MSKEGLSIKLLVCFAAAGLCGLFQPSAGACDHGKIIQSARGAMVAKSSAPSSTAHSEQAAKGGSTESATPEASSAAPTITGLWDVTDYYQGELIDEYFDTWVSDGNEFFIDGTNPIEGNVCQGTWIPAGLTFSQPASSRTFKLKHVAWGFDDQGNLQYRAIFHDTITMSADGQSFTGTENVYLYYLDGSTEEYLGDTLHGKRISVDF